MEIRVAGLEPHRLAERRDGAGQITGLGQGLTDQIMRSGIVGLGLHHRT